MSEDIAVFVGEDGQTVSLYNPGAIKVYKKVGIEWRIERQMPFSLTPSGSLKEIRQRMREALVFLDECRIIASLNVTGVPYFELEKAGFSIWETPGEPKEFLEYILEEEQKQRHAPEATPLDIPEPIEVSPGCFKISLKDIQKCDGLLTSKKILMPFLGRGEFTSLEILCDHVPPWVEERFHSGQLCGSIEHTAINEIKVTITKS